MRDLEQSARWPRALVRLALARPRTVLGVWALVVLAASVGVAQLRVETATDSALDRRGPAWAFYQLSQEWFGGDEIITVLVAASRPFEPAALSEVVRLTREIERMPGVRRVDSLATVPVVFVDDTGFISLEPGLDGGPVDAAAAAALKERLARDRIAPRNLVSDDALAFAVNAVLDRSSEAHYPELLPAIEAALPRDREAWVSGVPAFRAHTDARTQTELRLLVPLTIAVVGACLLWLFGTWRAALVPLASSGAATWLVLAGMGWTGTPLSISTTVLPSILLALGSAYSMHFLTVPGGSRDEAGLLDVALPVTLSGVTTALGFIAISLVRIDLVQQIGGFGALGTGLVLLATLTVVPAALRLWPLAPQHQRPQVAPALVERLVKPALARPGWTVALWLAVTAVAGVGIARIEVETDVTRWFSRSDPVRIDYEEIRRRLSGISPMNVVIQAPDGGSVASAETMAALAGLSAHLEAQPSVGRAFSIADPLRQLHGGFLQQGDGQPLPDSDALVNEYLLLLESKSYVRDLLTRDHRAANLRMRVDDNSSEELLRVARSAEAWWQASGPAGTRARTTGVMHEFARSEDAIALGQIRGLAFALLAVGAVLLLILRWPAVVAAAIAPNALPIAIGFGLMGYAGIALDAGTVTIGSLALGIAVDDSIHATASFHRRMALGDAPHQAIVAGFESVVAALAYTTLVIGLGFLVLGASGFSLIRNLGLVTALVMVICLLANLVLLPALLLLVTRRRTADA